jgi:hypothetical protein
MLLGSSYDEGWVGGESPMMLIKLDGEPARGPIALAQSLALGAVLAEMDVADSASRSGDAGG